MSARVARNRLHGYALVLWLALARVRCLREQALRLELFRQVHNVGIAALPVTLTLAALSGAAAVTQIMSLAGQNSDAAQSWLFYGLYFEMAPMVAALVVVARSSASIAAELGVMRQHDEYITLRRLGVSPANYLLLPRIYGMALSLPALTVFSQVAAVLGGWLAVTLVQGIPLSQLAGHFVELADPWLALLSLAKSAITGALVAVIACHHGSSVGRSPRDLSYAAIHAVGSGMVAVFLVDLTVAACVYALYR